ncbi:MAG: hypothetical protein PHG66_06315 [Candidatus Colwellbacteria bacterium]|nr:hypothetical protein [Candidatus Colwellbacteria bacterium]
MASRRVKQFGYGFLYLLIMVLLGVGAYFLMFKPMPTCTDGILNQKEEEVDCGGPCGGCDLRHLKINITEKKFFDISSLKQTTFYLEFENQSGAYWVNNFHYVLNVYNILGTRTAVFSGNSTIPPNSKRVIPIVGTPIDAKDISRVDLGVEDPEWTPTVEYRPSPISISGAKSQKLQNGKIYTSGFLVNDSQNTIRNISVGSLFKDGEGRLINVSSTKIDEVAAFSKTAFEIYLVPNAKPTIDLSRTEIFTEIMK